MKALLGAVDSRFDSLDEAPCQPTMLHEPEAKDSNKAPLQDICMHVSLCLTMGTEGDAQSPCWRRALEALRSDAPHISVFFLFGCVRS